MKQVVLVKRVYAVVPVGDDCPNDPEGAREYLENAIGFGDKVGFENFIDHDEDEPEVCIIEEKGGHDVYYEGAV